MGFNQYLTQAVESGHWARPSGWVSFPTTLQAGDEKFYGVYAIYENKVNELTVNFACVSDVSVDWGDGNSTTSANGVDTTHIYTYANINSPIVIDEGGYSYKTVIVEFDFTGTTTTIVRISRPGTTEEGNGNWLDIIIDNSDMVDLEYSAARSSTFLERIVLLNNNLSSDLSFGKDYTSNLKVLQGWDFSSATNVSNMFERGGDIRDENGDGINFDFSSATTGGNIFNDSLITKAGNVIVTTGTMLYRCFFNCTSLRVVGNVTLTGASSLQDTFYNNYNLYKIGTITSSATLTRIDNTFRFCRKLEDVEITDCSAITNTTNTFVFCESLRNVILTGLTVSINLSNNNMGATEIDALFTSLGTAAGAQTVTVTGNPGAATCTTSIATAKGWTVAV